MPRITKTGIRFATNWLGRKPTAHLSDEQLATVSLIARNAKTHNQYCENLCTGNGPYASKGDNVEYAYAKLDTLETRISGLGKQLGSGYTVETQRDPRGHTVKLRKGNDNG